MRANSLAKRFDQGRWPRPVSPDSAHNLMLRGARPVTGRQVASRYGLLAHYLPTITLPAVVAQASLGGPGGTWLTPTPYAGCVASYYLGLRSPRDLCMLVDVSRLAHMWGPGTAIPSNLYPTIWRGGAMEFFVPGSIPLRHVRAVIRLHTCGDPT